MLAMTLTISLMHQAASRTNAFHPYGALQMANVISSLLVGSKMESAIRRSKKKTVKHTNFVLQRHLLKLSQQGVSHSSKLPQVGRNPSKLTDVELSTTQRAGPYNMKV
jgi:hypothetical protein